MHQKELYISLEKISLSMFIDRTINDAKIKSERSGKNAKISLRKHHWIYLIQNNINSLFKT